jgi:protease secretion system membrane fusion protein
MKLISIINKWVDSLNPYNFDRMVKREGLEPIEIAESKSKKSSGKFFLIFFAVFLVWAFWAPLDSGVDVAGTVVVKGHRKAVQHPTGGVVSDILVKEGSIVNQGDILIRINPLSIEAELISAELDYINALTEEARLLAEREGRRSIVWGDELNMFLAQDKINEAKLLQERLFYSRLEDVAGQQRILHEQILGLRNQIADLKLIQDERKYQLKIISEEAKSSAELASEGFVSRSQANQIERQRSDLVAGLTATASDISKAINSITAARLQMAQLKAVYRKDIDMQAKEIQKNRKILKSRVDALRFSLGLTELKAPVGGTVVGMKVYTVGGVISGGQVLMEIVPIDHHLIVNAKVPTNLIDKVQVGLEANMRFTAFNQVTTPVIPGRVSLVGADKLMKQLEDDSITPSEYYVAQIETTPEGYKLLGDKNIQAGMPVSVIIKTGERTFISYILKPITDRMITAFQDE